MNVYTVSKDSLGLHKSFAQDLETILHKRLIFCDLMVLYFFFRSGPRPVCKYLPRSVLVLVL